MNHNYQVLDDRIMLRPLSAEDAQLFRQLRNRNSQRFFNAAHITEETQKKWYVGYLKKEDDIMFSVLLLPERQWIGAVGIYDINKEARTCEFGRLLIDRESVSQAGLGLDVTEAACKFAFEQLGMDKICLEVYTDNFAAINTYCKAGFSLNRAECHKGQNILRMSKNRRNNV